MPLQLRRGIEADRTSVTPADGEPLVILDDGEYKLYVGDGVTAGGHAIAGGGGVDSPLTTKGDLWVFSSGDTRLPAGSNGQVLTADSAQALGVKWASAPAATVSQFTQDVDGAGFELQDVRVVGNVDVPYDLATDSDGLITSGTAALTPLYNVYYYADLTSALTLTLPSPEAGTAPYGQVTIGLGTGGSVSVSNSVVWGKVDPTDPNGVIPTGAGQVFTLFYRYDPVSTAYVLNLEYLEVIAGGGGQVEVVSGSGQVSAIPDTNRNTFNHTHNYVSATQDGTVYLVVVFAGDRVGTSDYTADGKTSVVNAGQVDHYDPRIIIAIYKPTQENLNSGSEAFLVTSSHSAGGETGQFFTFEIKGANPTNPVDTTGELGMTLTEVTSAGPLSITSNQSDSLALVVAGAGNRGGGQNLELTTSNAAGFTFLGGYSGSAGIICEFMVHVKAVDNETFDSPSYVLTGHDDGAPIQILSVVFRP